MIMSSSSLSLILLPSYIFLLLLSSSVPANGRLFRLRKPDPNDAAATARWLVCRNSWGVLSTISSDLEGAPFGNVVSFSDGPPGDGRGIPYFYLTTLDPTARDALKDDRSSFTLSEFPLGTCGDTDPENPTCAKLTLTGKRNIHVLKNPDSSDGCENIYHNELNPVSLKGSDLKRSILRLKVETLAFSMEPHVPHHYYSWAQEQFFIDWEFRRLKISILGLYNLKLVDSQSTEAEFAQLALFSKHAEMKDWPEGHHFQIFKLDIEDIFLIDWFGGAKPLSPAQYLNPEKNQLLLESWA